MSSFDSGAVLQAAVDDQGRQTWWLLESGQGSSPFNMALDEVLFEAIALLQTPLLRFYGWMEPAASFGYFQKYQDIEKATSLRPLVRRPTAGGLVPHDSDWTYSLMFPPGHAWYSYTAIVSYRRVHEWIQQAFRILHIETTLADGARSIEPGQCFSGYEKFDLLWHNRKIAGAAQRRNRLGLLIQGSVQPPAGQGSLNRTAWQEAMLQVAQGRGVNWQKFDLPRDTLQRALELSRDKYSQPSYTAKR